MHGGVRCIRTATRSRALASRLLNQDSQEAAMADLIFILVTGAFFVLAAAYVRACDKL